MNTFVRYLKTRALRQIIQWLVVAGISITVLGAFAVADAYAQSSTYVCSDIVGSTGGTCAIDEGCMDFDAEPPSETFAGEICGPETAIVGGEVQDFELHGWVWDTNLGYISLYCGADGKNNGANCGSIQYGVKVDIKTGKTSGWAWSDNMGWISFGCQDGLNEGYSCGGVDYSASVEMTVNKDLGKITGYAWADSVGWFDFETGDVGASILKLVIRPSANETNWGVWTKIEIGDETLPSIDQNAAPKKNTMPLADKSATNYGYDLFLHLSDLSGNPIETSAIKGVQVDITTQWQDTVKYDQTTTSTENYNNNNNGAVSKPSTAGGGADLKISLAESTTGGVTKSYWGVVKSSAPTDGGNCYDNGDGDCYSGDGNFLYKDFGNGVTSNSLTYLGSNVTITLTDTGEMWTEFISPLAPYTTGKPMDFRPVVDIPELDYLFVPGDMDSKLPFIQAIRNKVDEFYIDATDNGTAMTYSIDFTLSEEEDDVNYVFINDLEDDPSTAPSTFTINDVALLGEKIMAMPFSQDEENLLAAVNKAMLNSIITVQSPGGTVKYYNNGLPRGAESEIETQTAEIISGGVFSAGAKNVVQGSDVPLFGDIAVYTLRTQILGDVSDLMRGINLDSDGSPVVIKSFANLDKNTFKDGRLYYFKNQDVKIEDISVLSSAAPGKAITVVVDGGDLYIENNIDEDQPFGFIVFESDDAVDGPGTTKGGRIYVHSDVTDMVDVHIFADGPMFRYTDNVCYYWGNYGAGLVGLREPNFVQAGRCSSAGEFKEPLSALVNQFYLKGNIASFNCLGCSTDLSPSRGDGLSLGGATALNFAIARLYDLNYFSYYREDPLNPGVFSGTHSVNLDGTKNKAVYFEYSPAPTDLLGFRKF